MGVSTTVKKVSYTCNGSTGPYPISFAITTDSSGNATNVGVKIRDSSGVETELAITTGYTISALNVYTVATYDNTNTVVIYRKMPFTQLRDWRNGDDFDAEILEDVIDEIVMHLQELDEKYSRNVFVPISDEAATMELPTKTERANLTLGFDADGEPVAGAGITAAVVPHVADILSDASIVDDDTFLAALGVTATGEEINLVADTSANVKVVDEANYAVLDDDGYLYILVETGSSDRTITLPTAADNYKRVLHIIKTDPAGTGAIIVDGEGSETVNGALTVTTKRQLTLVCGIVGTTYLWTAEGQLVDEQIPVGTIIASAQSSATPPTGFLYCAGAAISRTTYAALFAAIGVAWGYGDQSTTFNLPDLRGQFLRARDDGASKDPNDTTRTASATGGATGDAVGSSQPHAILSHTHEDFIGHNGTDSGWGSNHTVAMPSGWAANAVQKSSVSSAVDTAGNGVGFTETRPLNLSVHYFIKY